MREKEMRERVRESVAVHTRTIIIGEHDQLLN